MGEVIYFPNAASQQPDPTNHAGLTQSEVLVSATAAVWW